MLLLLVFRGRGWIVGLLTLAMMVLTQLVTERLFGPGYYGDAPWPISVAMAVSGVAAYFIGDRWNANMPPESRFRFFFGSRAPHTFLSFRLEAFGLLMSFGAAILLVYRLTRLAE